jgi:hypothetical protein
LYKHYFLQADVPEVLANVCGVICNNYLITELADDSIKRDYGVFNGKFLISEVF